ncbi:hypothetical protein D3C85_1722810 [compost metagenome]
MDLRKAGRFVYSYLCGRVALLNAYPSARSSIRAWNQLVADAPMPVVLDRAFHLKVPFWLFHSASWSDFHATATNLALENLQVFA